MSLDSVALIVDVEKALKIDIANSDAEKIETVGDLYECSWKYVKELHPTISRSEVESIINNVFVEGMGFELKDITPEKSITRDLGID